jgi:hypothetical protein
MMALEVIPAKAGIQKTDTGFRIKCGMTLRGQKHPPIALQDTKMLISTEISRRYNASRQHPDRVNL